MSRPNVSPSGAHGRRRAARSTAGQLALFGAQPHVDQAESQAFLTQQVLTYIGNKRALLDFIGLAVAKVQRTLGRRRLDTFDVFSGSGIVARYLKQF